MRADWSGCRAGTRARGAPSQPGGSTTTHVTPLVQVVEKITPNHTRTPRTGGPPPHTEQLSTVWNDRVCAQGVSGGGGGEKILENVGFYRKTNLRYCPIPSAAKSPIWWGRNSTGGTKRPPAPNFRAPKWKKKAQKQRGASGRASPGRRGRKASRSPRERHFKGESTAHQRELRRKEEGWRRRSSGWVGGGGTGNLPSIQELSAQIQLLGGSCPSNPLRSRPHGASTYGPFRLKSVCGEKNALETREGGGSAFLPPPFLLPTVSGCHAALRLSPAGDSSTD